MGVLTYLPGDVVLTKGMWLIRWGTQYTGEGKGSMGHAGVGVNQSFFVEALWRVVLTAWDGLSGRGGQVWRYIPFTDEQRKAIADKADDYLGRKYGWWKIALQGIDCILGKLFFTDVYLARRLGRIDKYPICSWVVAFAYDRGAGYSFGKEPNAATPDDIYDHVRNTEGWIRVA